jgi:predicted site-specific integrase-resolvase
MRFMAKRINPVKEAVVKVGGPTRAANICDVSGATVHNWIKAGRITNLGHALKLAEAAEMGVKELAGE